MVFYRNFLMESVMGLFSVVLMGAMRSTFSFKETLVLYFALMVLLNYLFFIKRPTDFDVFDVLFPQMTIFQLKQVIMDNFFTNITFMECEFSSLHFQLRQRKTERSKVKAADFETTV